jgi:putative transposase
MPRANRIELPNSVHHITQRGFERRPIVIDDDDRSHWWRLFDRVALRCQWRVFAVVLLNNHFHIYLRITKPNLSAGMHDLDGGYASLFNQLHEREGSLYQGRFKSVLIENESHSWELSRYVHLNPCRAHLVSDPFLYSWSSYRYFLDSRKSPDWLDWKTVLAEFAGTEAGARLAYKRFVESGLTQPPRNPLRDVDETGIFGSPEFVKKVNEWQSPVSMPSITLDRVMSLVCVEFCTTLEKLMQAGQHDNVARDAAVLLSREFLSEPLDTIAARFGAKSRSSITEIVKRANRRAEQDEKLHDKLEDLRNQLSQQR